MDEMEYSSDVEYETKKDNNKKKFQLTRGMLLLIIGIIAAVIVIVVLISRKTTNNKPEYSESDFKRLEERMEEEAGIYFTNNNIELVQGNSLKIELSELLLENGGTIDKNKIVAAKVCDGYVLAKNIENSTTFKPYIDCGDYYKTEGYNSNLDVSTTTKKSKDTIVPTITIIGDKEITITVGSDFKDPGAKAIDDTDGDLTSMIRVSGSVDTKKVGKYKIEYSVSDKAGNISTEYRMINVIDVNITSSTTQNRQTTRRTTVYTNRTNATVQPKPQVCSEPPTITLKSSSGSISVTLNVGERYVEPGYSAIDCNGSNITSSVSVSSNVNTKAAGTYQINYTVTDFNGRTSKKTRTVFVKYTYIKVASISITPNNFTIKKGEKIDLMSKISISPSNATNKSVSFSSSNTRVATVNQNGIVQTGSETGTATITVRAENNISNTCFVTVKK